MQLPIHTHTHTQGICFYDENKACVQPLHHLKVHELSKCAVKGLLAPIMKPRYMA
jgi:hypothetical protein